MKNQIKNRMRQRVAVITLALAASLGVGVSVAGAVTQPAAHQFEANHGWR